MFFRFSKIRKKNRKRFKSVISDPRFNYLEPVLFDLEKGNSISEDEIMDAYHKFWGSIYSNTVSMAELHLVVTASIAVYRPELTPRMVEELLLMLYLSFGEHFTLDKIQIFIENRILNKVAEPYGGIPNKKARKWLRSFVKKNNELLEKKLTKVIAENDAELED